MYNDHMKITLNIDDALLERVREATGAKTKTEAIHTALREMDRRRQLVELLGKDDFGLTPDEWRNAWEDPCVDEMLARVAEEPPTYGTKPRTDR
jgi:Arc/MetJ family transcription regulator